MKRQKKYFSNGKLLLSGEYAVINGATALALPVKMGQSIHVFENSNNILQWEAYVDNNLWFFAEMDIETFEIIKTNIKSVAERLRKIIIAGIKLNLNFKNKVKSKIVTHLGFNKNWGLGSSSTLISNVAYWAEIDPFNLFNIVSEGSGYDIAAARIKKPFLYSLKEDKTPFIKEFEFNNNFLDNIFFIYLGNKQNSQKSVENYRKKSKITQQEISEISDISKQMSLTENLNDFQYLMTNHEKIISRIINQTPVKDLFFNDFKGSIKSLGAWGGDFIMAATNSGKDYVKDYFYNKNLKTVFNFNEIAFV